MPHAGAVAGGDLHQIFEALARERVRYLVVGGVAVVLHGHPRFTADLDLVIQLEPANALKAIEALASLGYRPQVPIPAAEFADADARRAWIEDKGLTVFALWSPQLPGTGIDLFVEEPFDFDAAYARGVTVELESTALVVASIDDLIAMKRRAGRPKDVEDIAALEAIVASGGGDGG
jgi:hypothetical protein